MHKYFRHPRTGKVTPATDAQAALFGLIEVGKDAKPLAFTPIPEARVAAVKSKKEDA